jgi:pSer/pThr/pTyr-binding forkhead associated (FHA) protein
LQKIIISGGEDARREVLLSKERITIGRGANNDVVLDCPGISVEHAAIVSSGAESFLEDLDSTNGSQVNGQPVSKHFLQNCDVIELGAYYIEYLNSSAVAEDPDLERFPAHNGVPVVVVLSGPHAGKSISLVKPLTTLGQSGMQVAVIMQRAEDYYLEHLEGEHYPIVNGRDVGPGSYRLAYGDLIDMLGVKMRFLRPRGHVTSRALAS